ncbi:MAG: hypothetical protein ABUL62_31880 [Myxococcales bacterium]
MTSSSPYMPPERVEPDVCVLCGLESYACVCPAPAQTTQAEIELARRSRLSTAELESETKS